MKNMYRGTDVGFGGYVYAEPGCYGNVALIDVASMHPSSIIAMDYFGEYTKNFQDIRDARFAIKHKDFDALKTMLGGKLAKYTEDPDILGDLSQALKIAINSVYGLTSAKFANPFHDPDNLNNVVALRGALFMRTLQDEVQKRGFIVAHIKTDSIKIPDATPEIIQFCLDFAKQYGYQFEHEGTYERMCLVNNAVYIAKYATVEQCCKLYGEEYVNSSKDICKDNKKAEASGEMWTATGAQFAVPYVFKTMFSHEPITFEDLCEAKSVQTAIYLDKNEGLGDAHDYIFVGKIGNFCPILPGHGGAELLREATDKNGERKFNSVTGAKGYRWLEAEMVRDMKKEASIDKGYYDKQVDEAIKTLSKYCDVNWFISKNSPYVGPPYSNGRPVYYPTED